MTIPFIILGIVAVLWLWFKRCEYVAKQEYEERMRNSADIEDVI